jgi:hypothetical protein
MEAGEFAQWFVEAVAYLKARGLSPSDLDGNPSFLQTDWESGLTPQQSIDRWLERAHGE